MIRLLFKVALWGLALLPVTACGGGSTIVVVLGAPPAAQIQVVDMLAAGRGTTIEFFGQGADPNCQKLTYSWDLDGDGAPDSALQSPSSTYGGAGDVEVTLTVTDDAGNTARATCIVSIADAPPGGTTAPAVQVRCNTLLATEGLDTFFNAASAENDGGVITSFDWDFDGDGIIDLSTATGQASNTYATSGQFTPVVTANSSDGSSSNASLTLYICPAGTIPDLNPGVQLERDPTMPAADVVALMSSFMATGADMDGGPSTFSWDFNEDGLFGDKVGRTVTTDPWPSAGPLQIQVRARDDEAKAGSAQAAICIGPVLTDTPPIAFARACTLLASTGTPVQFLGFGDDTQDGTGGVTYSWDIDGDGVADDTAQNPTFTFTERGVYTPTVTVRDTTGNIAEAWLTIIVECCSDFAGFIPPPRLPPPYWWCDCADAYIYHGGNVDVLIQCPTRIGFSGPTEAGIAACNGGFLDPACAQATVSHPPAVGTGPPFFPPASLHPIGSGPFSFNFLSDPAKGAVDLPLRVVHYTVQVKLHEAGVRVQQLKCQVFVLHGFIGGGGSGIDLGGGNFVFSLGLGINQPAGVQLNPPPIYGVEILLQDQVPPWTSVALDANAGVLPPGWQVAAVTDMTGATIGVRFFTTTTPVISGQPLNIQGIAGLVPGKPPNSMIVRLARLDGTIVGMEQLQLTYP